MKHFTAILITTLLSGVSVSLAATSAHTQTTAQIQEDWKGRSPDSNVTLSPMFGAAFRETGVGIAVAGSAAIRLLEHGFIPDINNQVFLETQLGGIFFPNRDVFSYAAQLRWDFVKDDRFTVFAVGGLGGRIGGGAWNIFPRFGVGMMVAVARSFDLRFDFTQDALMTGLSFPLTF